MVEHFSVSLHSLYHNDETAWLEIMSRIVAERRCDEIDYDHLSEYLSDMARRDKREVVNRLAVLLAHLLKWEKQPDRRSSSWQATIIVQRQELNELFESRTLFEYGQASLAKAYERAIKQAAVETDLADSDFPEQCPLTLDDILRED